MPAMLLVRMVRMVNCGDWRAANSRRKISRDALEPAGTPVPVKPSPAARPTRGHMAVSALPELGEPVFERREMLRFIWNGDLVWLWIKRFSKERKQCCR